MKQANISNQVFGLWNKVPLVIRAIVTGFLVSSVGIAIWSLLLLRLAVPWPILPMIIALWAYCKFFSGSWGSRNFNETKKERFRNIRLSPSVWKWGIAGAIFFVIIMQASFVITFRIIEFPADRFTADYKMLDKMPQWTAWAILIMSSVVAGICEETGFRGYMQVPLEKKYGATVAIILTSIIFTAIHLSHSWALPILPHIFFASVLLGILAWRSGSLIPGIIGHSILDVFDYSVWWTDLTGKFERQTVFKTGIDIHFVIWAFVFLISLFAFFKTMARLEQSKKAGMI